MLYPTEEDWVDLSAFESDAGACVIPLLVDEPAGGHLDIVAAVPTELEIDWSEPPGARWTEVRERVEDGLVEAAAVRLQVRSVASPQGGGLS